MNKFISTKVVTFRHLRKGMLMGLLLVLTDASSAFDCIGPGWPSQVSYSASAGADTGALSFGPSILAGFQFLENYQVTGNRVQLIAVLVETCGIGVPPPPDLVHVPVSALPPGHYLVNAEFRAFSGGASILVQDLPLVVTGTVTAAIPALGSKGLLALGGLLLIVGAALLQRRRRRHQVASPSSAANPLSV